MSGQFRGDFTIDRFAPFKHYVRVLIQQGRVQLDSDWNEQAAILLHSLRRLGKDVIGPAGAVARAFLLSPLRDAAGTALADFLIERGNFYVDGWLCELNSTSLPVVLGPNFDQAFIPSEQIEGVDLIPPQPARAQPQYVAVFDQFAPALAPIVLPIPAGYDGKAALTGSDFSGMRPNPHISIATTYLTQPDLPVPPLSDLKSGPYLAYLDVWERHICAAEDDSILEVALGGPDTASRSKVVAQVKLTNRTADSLPIPSFENSDAAKKNLNTLWPSWVSEWQPPNRGWLLAQTTPQSVANTNPCMISPTAQYRGQENQLYRVEVHTGSGGVDATGKSIPPTFKWSRENGSVVFSVVSVTVSSGASPLTSQVQLAGLGRDARFGLKVGDWVEFVNDDSTLMNWSFTLLQVQAVNTSNTTVTLAGAVDTSLLPDPRKGPKHPLLRRWDHQQVDSASTNVQWSSADNAIQIVEASGNPAAPWIDLENGIQIQFQPAPGPVAAAGNPGSGNVYRAADYWLIPARTANGGELLWPTDASGNAVACSPHGVTHHYAPLAFVIPDATGRITSAPIDVRAVIQPIAS
jgi:hypothetical protein